MSKRDDIIGAAIIEFGKKSYDAASVNRIIKASGTSKGTFYHYFKDKKALYFSIIEEAVRIKQEYFAHMMVQVKQKDSNLFDVLKAQAKAAGQFMRDHPELYQFGAMFAIEQNAVRDEFMKKYLPDIGESFLQVVNTGIRKGSFSDRFPPDFIVRVIWHMTMNYYDILFDQGEMPTPKAIEERMDMLFDFLRRGFS